jgi:accessory gene regulator B
MGYLDMYKLRFTWNSLYMNDLLYGVVVPKCFKGEKGMKRFSVDDFATSVINYFRKSSDIDENQEAILRFSIHVLISMFFGLVLALSLALLVGTFYNVLFIVLTTAIFRSFSGGAHSETMLGCAIYGTVVMNIFGIMTKYTHPSKGVLSIIILFTLLFSLWSINKYAPADTPGKPITTKVKRQKLKRFSFLTLFIWFGICITWYTGLTKYYIFAYSSSLGVLWQSFSLTSWGYGLLHHMDRTVQRINKKEEII